MKKRIADEEIEKAIILLLEEEDRSMSIRELSRRLDQDFKIKKSPHIIKHYLEDLKKRGVITEI